MTQDYFTSKKDWQNAKNNKSNKKSMGLAKYATATPSHGGAVITMYPSAAEVIARKMKGVIPDRKKTASALSELRKSLSKKGIIKKSN